MFSLEDLKLGAKGDLQKLHQGRRVQFTLGGQGTSIFSYRAVLLDAQEQSGPFLYECGVFIVPKVFFLETKLILLKNQDNSLLILSWKINVVFICLDIVNNYLIYNVKL